MIRTAVLGGAALLSGALLWRYLRSHRRRTCVCIVGAGVVGLSTALRLTETGAPMDITIIADKFLDETTSHGAGGLWEPVCMEIFCQP